MTKEALTLALEALAVRFSEGWHEGIKIDASDIMLLNDAAQALAQPEQEPVGYWMGEFNDGSATLYEVPQESVFGRKYRNIPVYTTPPQPKEHLEPVAWNDENVIKYCLKRGIEAAKKVTPQRKPLLIGKESTEFAKWFNAVWLGDGEQGETIPTSGKEYDEYLSQYTLAFGAWMAAKEAAHGIKENT